MHDDHMILITSVYVIVVSVECKHGCYMQYTFSLYVCGTNGSVCYIRQITVYYVQLVIVVAHHVINCMGCTVTASIVAAWHSILQMFACIAYIHYLSDWHLWCVTMEMMRHSTPPHSHARLITIMLDQIIRA